MSSHIDALNSQKPTKPQSQGRNEASHSRGWEIRASHNGKASLTPARQTRFCAASCRRVGRQAGLELRLIWNCERCGSRGKRAVLDGRPMSVYRAFAGQVRAGTGSAPGQRPNLIAGFRRQSEVHGIFG
jgi:hypothetical protein